MSNQANVPAALPLSAQALWAQALEQLKLQMTRATFEAWVKETRALSLEGQTLTVAVRSAAAQDWLVSRLRPLIERAVTAGAGRPLEVSFVLEPAGSAVAEVEAPDAPGETAAGAGPSLDQQVAQADYYKGFYEKGGAGFSLLSHHTTFYWMPLLGPAFFLWKFLDAEDPRSLKSIAPNYWSLPQKYSYVELAARLNRKHSRYICGDALECHQSALAREAGNPLRSPGDCCGCASYDWLRQSPHPGGQGLICKHWSDGLLEVLCREGLAAVELNAGERKPTLQVWRMPPVLTPRQYARLNAELQADYDRWLERYGPLFGLHSRQQWQAIEASTLAPLMPGYEQAQVSHNFEERPKKREFRQAGFANPRYSPEAAGALPE